MTSSFRVRREKRSPSGPTIDIDGRTCLNFASNDYLGLANSYAVSSACRASVESTGLGSAGSPIICGYTSAHAALEKDLADALGRERAVLFSTGYMANLGVVTSFVQPGDLLVFDALNHASLIDAALLSRATLRRYPHADVLALRKILAQPHPKTRFVITDSVFSMSGDIAPLEEIAWLCLQFQAVLIVDDAHAFGVLGQQGTGSQEHFGLKAQDIPLLIGTMGKAMGTFGAFVVGDARMIERIISSARTYIYSTSLPAPLVAASRAALVCIQRDAWRRDRLRKLIQVFRSGAELLSLPIGSSITPIQPLICGDFEQAARIANRLLSAGIFVHPVGPPTVPRRQARLRISLTATHTNGHIEKLLSALAKVRNLF